MKNIRTAIFGSAFNPPHRGHEDVIRQALQQFQTIVIVPSYCHAFGKDMMPWPLRLQMVKVIVNDMKEKSRIQISPIEQSLYEYQQDPKPIYTYDVLSALEKTLASAELTFVVGPDNALAATWDRFYKAQEIRQRWGVWAAEERIQVRSTLIREKISLGIQPSPDECHPGVTKLLMDNQTP